MFVCLCTGATREIVAEVVAKGAMTSNQVAAACGAGIDCGRCRHTVRAIIAAGRPSDTASATPLADLPRICRQRLTHDFASNPDTPESAIPQSHSFVSVCV